MSLLFNGVYAQLPLDVWTVLGNLVFMQGFLVNFIGSNPPLWTLSIECLCYLLAPLFFRLNTKRLLILIALSSLSFAIYPYLMNFWGLKGYHYAFLSYGLGFIMLLWAWLLGFFYFISSKKEESKVLIIALGCLLLEQNQVVTSRWVIATYVLSALILIYSSQIKIPSFLLNSFNYLGELSYPLYLFHVPVLICSYSLFAIKNPVILVAFSLITSMFFYHIVDRPLRPRKINEYTYQS